MEGKRAQLTRSRTMFASRPTGRISASDVHCESELEGISGSDSDRGRFLEVGGRVTVVDEERVRVYVGTARGGSWVSGSGGCPTTRMSSLKRFCKGSEPLGAGTGLPEESVYVQSLDAKKLKGIEKTVIRALEL